MVGRWYLQGIYSLLADYYSLFGVNHGEKEQSNKLEKFDDYLKLNITGEGKPKKVVSDGWCD